MEEFCPAGEAALKFKERKPDLLQPHQTAYPFCARVPFEAEVKPSASKASGEDSSKPKPDYLQFTQWLKSTGLERAYRELFHDRAVQLRQLTQNEVVANLP